MRRLEVRHRKILRKILGMNTTYIERANTNEEVWKRVERGIGGGKKVTCFTDAYSKLKLTKDATQASKSLEHGYKPTAIYSSVA